jgi:hypothetical protein
MIAHGYGDQDQRFSTTRPYQAITYAFERSLTDRNPLETIVLDVQEKLGLCLRTHVLIFGNDVRVQITLEQSEDLLRQTDNSSQL